MNMWWGKKMKYVGMLEVRRRFGRWRIGYGKLRCRAKPIMMACCALWLWGTFGAGALCLVAQGMGGGSNSQELPPVQWKLCCFKSEDPFVFWYIFCCCFFPPRLEIKWSRIELHKTSSCAHENVGTGGKDRWECGAIICTGIEVGPEIRWGERCLQATVNTS